MPVCATFIRFPPSSLNGRVTTATVRMFMLFAMSAITGAAPVPVPPPMPAVMNSMSEPSIISAMRSRSSMAASRPISGRAPAPRPRVSAVPICTCTRAVERFSACASVFAQMNSTSRSPLAIMCSTALPPHPPTPMTLMTAPLWVGWSMISNMVRSFLLSQDAALGLCLTTLWHERLEIRLEPLLHPFRGAADAGGPRP